MRIWLNNQSLCPLLATALSVVFLMGASVVPRGRMVALADEKKAVCESGECKGVLPDIDAGLSDEMGLSDTDDAADAEGRDVGQSFDVSDDDALPKTYEMTLELDAAGGRFADGSSRLTMCVNSSHDAGDKLLFEACDWEGRRLLGWATEVDGGVEVLDAEGCLLDGALEGFADAGDDLPPLVLFAWWEELTVTERVTVLLQRPDGSYGDVSEIHEIEALYGEELSWSREESDVFEAQERTWHAEGVGLVVEVPRRAWSVVVDSDVLSSKSVDVLVGAEMDLGELAATIVPESYQLEGWEAQTAGGECVYDPDEVVCDLVPAGECCTLTPILALSQVTLAFEPGCPDVEVTGIMDDLLTERGGRSVCLPACEYVRKGYTFTGWISDTDEGDEVLGIGAAFDVSAVVSERVVFCAVWEPLQVRVSVPVSVDLEEDDAGGGRARSSAIVFSNESDREVELAAVVVKPQGFFHLVPWGQVSEDTDIALALEMADGQVLDLSEGDVSAAGLTLERGLATMDVAIICETGADVGETDELCSLLWVFRVAGVEA